MKLRGIYAITDEHLLPDEQFLPAMRATLAAGVQLIQYRNKKGDADLRLRQAGELLALCRANRTPLIINDDVELCAAIGADGVHLGQNDCGLAEARERLGSRAIIGVTCHQSLELARVAAEAGADYVAFGRFFPSTTKPGATPANPTVLHEASQSLNVPVVAIGGINADNGGMLIDSGADMLAVVGGIYANGSIASNIRTLNSLFSQSST